MIVVAIVGNAAEHSTAIIMAMKNKMDLSVGIAIGSSLQIALFVAPVLVFLSYAFGQPMDLEFSLPEIFAVVASIYILFQISGDGETNWIEGVQLLSVYLILGVLFFLPAGDASRCDALRRRTQDPASGDFARNHHVSTAMPLQPGASLPGERARPYPASRARDSLRHRHAGIQRAFHVADKFVAGVLTGEMQPTDPGVQNRSDRRHLPRRGKGIAGAGPHLARPIHKARRTKFFEKSG